MGRSGKSERAAEMNTAPRKQVQGAGRSLSSPPGKAPSPALTSGHLLSAGEQVMKGTLIRLFITLFTAQLEWSGLASLQRAENLPRNYAHCSHTIQKSFLSSLWGYSLKLKKTEVICPPNRQCSRTTQAQKSQGAQFSFSKNHPLQFF